MRVAPPLSFHGLTAAAFENAIRTVMALGGSTNAVLHLIAMARAVDVSIGLDDFQRISDSTPFIGARNHDKERERVEWLGVLCTAVVASNPRRGQPPCQPPLVYPPTPTYDRDSQLYVVSLLPRS
jgi:hypothetical protein